MSFCFVCLVSQINKPLKIFYNCIITLYLYLLFCQLNYYKMDVHVLFTTIVFWFEQYLVQDTTFGDECKSKLQDKEGM